MIINPNTIIEKSAISGPYRVEPNAFDFTANNIQLINSNTLAYYSNTKANVIHRDRLPVDKITNAQFLRSFGYPDEGHHDASNKHGWLLNKGQAYDVTSDVYVKVPEGLAAVIVGRSTGNRNAIIVVSGLYDSGYEGHVGCTLYNLIGATYLEEGTFIGQIVFMDADSAKLYAGGYNNKQGEHWTEAVSASADKSIVNAEPEVVSPKYGLKSNGADETTPSGRRLK